MCILFIRFVSAAGTAGSLNINIIESQCLLDFGEGWNFFSFCRNLIDKNASNVFSSAENNYRYIMRWNQEKQEFDIFSPRSSRNPVPDLNDDESYFIYFYSNSYLDVNGTSPGDESRNLVEGWNAPSYQLGFSKTIDSLTLPIEYQYRYIMKWNLSRQEFDIFSQKSLKNPFGTIDQEEGFFIYSKEDLILNIFNMQ